MNDYEENNEDVYFEDENGKITKSAMSSNHKNRIVEAALKRHSMPAGMNEAKLWKMFIRYLNKELASGSAPFKKVELDKVFDSFLNENFA